MKHVHSLRNVLLLCGFAVAVVLAARADEDARKQTIKKLEAFIAAEEKKSEAEETIDEPGLRNVLKQLQELQWKLDGIAAVAFVQNARAQVLLRQHDAAIETLKMGADHIAKIEAVLEEQGRKDASPLAGALLYYGRALRGNAIASYQKGDSKAAQALLLEAAKRFRKVVAEYGDSPYRAQAENDFDACCEILANRFGVNLRVK